MDIADAMQIVIELARQNVADQLDNPEHHAEQEAAIDMVEDFAVNQGRQPMKYDLIVTLPGFNQWRRAGYGISSEFLARRVKELHSEGFLSVKVQKHPSPWPDSTFTEDVKPGT